MKWLLILITLYAAVRLSKILRNRRTDQQANAKVSSSENHKPNSYKSAFNDVNLSDEQKNICQILDQSNEHAFITGRAGTGKSVLLKYFATFTTKRCIVVAPTGIAAMNISGQTIHSLFKLPSGFINPKKLTINDETRRLLSNIDTIIIDEISMVRADTIDAIDSVLRNAKGNKLPFGGVQIIAFGDVYQLPPVVEGAELRKYFEELYGGPYFFNASVWNETDLRKYELQTVFRQSNKQFKMVLDAIRNGSPTQADFDVLRTRVVKPEEVPGGKVITLTTRNTAAKAINDSRLNLLRTRSKTFYASITGEITANSFPTDSELILKVGAQVMFLKNDPAKRWVNGTIGTVRSFSKDTIRIYSRGETHEVLRSSWEKSHYYYDEGPDTIEKQITSSFTQFPLRLAWAITIHKSQGCSYAKVAIDIRDGAFAHGQTYVALSRCRSLAGLYLLGEIKPSDIIVDPAIVDFMKQPSAN